MIGRVVPNDHAIVPWLLEHTALLLCIQSRLPDGLTPWARARGRSFAQKIVGFGERIQYKLPSKGPLSRPDGNMGARWQTGVFLGYNRHANTFIVGTKDGTVSARSLSRFPEQTRWSSEALSEVQATPWSGRQRHDPEVIFRDPAAPAEPAATAAPT